MIDRQRVSEFFQANRWRIPFLVLFSIVAAVGYNACSLDREYVSLYSVSFDGRHVLVDCYLPDNQSKKLVVAEDGTIRCFLPSDSESSWTTTGGLIVKGDDRVALLRFSEDDRTVIERLPMPPHANHKFLTASGAAVYVEVSTYFNDSHFVRIFKNEIEIKCIYFGSSERAYPRIQISPRGKVCFSICFSPQRNSSVIDGEKYRQTDGKQATTLILDPESAEALYRFKGDYWPTNSDRHLVKRNEQGQMEIVAMSDRSRPLIRMPLNSSQAVFVDDHLVIARPPGRQFNPGKHVLMDLETKESHELPFAVEQTLVPARRGYVYYADNQGVLRILNVKSGQSRSVFTFRSWYKLKQAVAFLGLPLLAVAWLWVSRRRNQFLPIVELTLLAAIGCACGIFWLSLEVQKMGSHLMTVTPALFYLLAAYVVIWGLNTRSLVGQGVPVLFFGFAAVLGLFRFYQRTPSYNNGSESFREMSRVALLISGMVISLLVTRYLFGRLQRETETLGTRSTRISIKQCFVVTCAVAVFFAIARLVGIKVSFGLEDAAWFFGGYLFVAVTWAYLCGAYVKRLWRSLLLFLPLIIGLFALYEWGVVQIGDFKLPGKPNLLQAISRDQDHGFYAPTIVGIRIRQYYLLASVQVTFVASLMFCSMRYCLACRWRPIANLGHDV